MSAEEMCARAECGHAREAHETFARYGLASDVVAVRCFYAGCSCSRFLQSRWWRRTFRRGQSSSKATAKDYIASYRGVYLEDTGG